MKHRKGLRQRDGPLPSSKSQKSNGGGVGRKKRCKQPKKKSDAGGDGDGDGDRGGEDNDNDMGDIMAQLRRQREKKQRQQPSAVEVEVESTSVAASGNNQTAKPAVPSNLKSTRPKKKRDYAANAKANVNATTNTNAKHEAAVGDFQYDPATKRYFPKSAYKPHGNNDVCVQRIQKQITEANKKEVGATDTDIDINNEHELFRLRGAVTAGDVSRVVFRGTLLPSRNNICCNNEALPSSSSMGSKVDRKRKDKKRRNNHTPDLMHENGKTKKNSHQHNIAILPCTDRTTLLLTTSLQYCTNTSKRYAIASMLGPRSVATRAKIVPTQSTLEMIQKDTSGGVKIQMMRNNPDNIIDAEGPGYEYYDDEPILRPYEMQKQSSKSGVQHNSLQNNESLRRMMPSTRRWFSMLHPLKGGPRESQLRNRQPLPWNNNSAVPYDCRCKSHLHPTASTFDILPGSTTDNRSQSSRRSAAMPYIATISNDDAIHYRTPHSNNNGRGDDYSAWELQSSPRSLQYHGVRFAPYHATERYSRAGLMEHSFVGCLTYDVRDDERNFSIHKTGTIKDHGTGHVETYGLASPVNDFCFMPDATLQDPGIVAFAHNRDGGVGASFLDITTKSYTSIRDNWCHSEPLCLQFRKNDNKNQVLFGHRDGCISLIDRRSGDALFASSAYANRDESSFGSATSIHPLKKDDNLVVCKGSFGSCRILDMRRLSNNNGSRSQYQQSTVLDMSIPDSMVHQTKSSKCTGLAIDPSESIAIAPFVGHDNDILFALWDMCTGELLRTMKLSSTNRHISSNVCMHKERSKFQFCELSSVITSGYQMLCKEQLTQGRREQTPIITSKQSSWGLWYKTNMLSDSSLPDGGGIHHISFQ